MRGNLLLTTEGMEPANILMENRNKVISNFLDLQHHMQCKCDCMFMTEDTLTHEYSFGKSFYGLLGYSWNEFRQIESLQGIQQVVFERLTNCIQKDLKPTCIENEEVFFCKQGPNGLGGYRYESCPCDFIHNIDSWENLKYTYLSNNPNEIEWGDCDFLPNQDEIFKILSNELISHQIHVNMSCDLHELSINFHEHVMKHKAAGGELEAYCSEIGGQVCRANYYRLERELSSMEQQCVHSKRIIWSICKEGKLQFISFDFETGHFEFHNNQGKHLGEYRFDGSLNKESDPTGRHDLQSINNWQKLNCRK